MVNPKFKAIYNIFTRELAVLYGNCVSKYTFKEMEEWTKVSFNGDENHPNYLHIQLDYDESAQLLFYPRQNNDEYLHEDEGTYFYSDKTMSEINNDQLIIVYNDDEWSEAELLHFGKTYTSITVPDGL